MMPLISLVLIDSDGKARNDTLSIFKSSGGQVDLRERIFANVQVSQRGQVGWKGELSKTIGSEMQ